VKRVVAAVWALTTVLSVAWAAGYDDFALGMTENLRGRYANAVPAFTAALAAPDLVAAYKPAAYRSRAVAYLNLDQCQNAMADLKAYEALKGADRSILVYRMWAALCLKDVATAERDFAAIAQGDMTVSAQLEFARLEWRFGLYDASMRASASAFKAANKKSEKAIYILLWQAVAAHRAGKLDTAAIFAGLGEIGLEKWPKPVFDLYLGKQTPDGVREEAKSWRRSRDQAQTCEANFYTAEWHLGRSEADMAVPLLLAVTKNCPIDFIELPAAVTELKRLGVPVPKE
jgi:hypothetical protein